LLLAQVKGEEEGEVLDIGCGNGPLTIRLAQRYPNARVIGVDYWGKQWAYAQGRCEKNAHREGVASRVGFQKASASALPFEEGRFDLVVSNLTFHEVEDTPDKRDVVHEALRVVKPGGQFVFQDLFLWKRIYGTPEELLAAVRGWGIERVEFIPTCNTPFIPWALKLPFMVGTIAILRGVK